MRRWKALIAVFALALCFVPASVAADDDAEGMNLTWHWFGSLRARPEYNDNLSDVSPVVDDEVSYANYRVNFGFSVDLDKGVSVLLDGQAYGAWGEDQTPQRGNLTTDNTSGDVAFYRAYIKAANIMDSNFSVTAGRQPLEYADEWLLGDSDFYAGTSWDAIRGDYQMKDDRGSVSLFWAKVAEQDVPETLVFTGDIGNDFDMYGIWTDWRVGDHSSLDVSALYGMDRRDVAGKGYTDKRFTGAVNYTYKNRDDGGFFFVGNGGLQDGRTLDSIGAKQEVEGWAYELTPGWLWVHKGENGEADRYTKIWVRAAEYSGDDQETNEVETWSPVAMDQHFRYGATDFWGGTFGHGAYIGGTPGFEALQLGFSTQTKVGIGLKGIIQQQRRSEKIGPGQDNRNLGQEIGVIASYDYGRNLTLELGVGQLFAGTAFSYEPPLFGQGNGRRAWLSATAHF